jgi:anti-anti-sigma factor
MSRTWTVPATDGSNVTEIHCLLDDDPARVVMVGEIDLLAKPAMDAALALLAEQDSSDVVVDLRAATVLSCVGVGFLYSLALQRGHRGGTVYVKVPAGRVARILELVGAAEAMVILHSP